MLTPSYLCNKEVKVDDANERYKDEDDTNINNHRYENTHPVQNT